MQAINQIHFGQRFLDETNIAALFSHTHVRACVVIKASIIASYVTMSKLYVD